MDDLDELGESSDDETTPHEGEGGGAGGARGEDAKGDDAMEVRLRDALTFERVVDTDHAVVSCCCCRESECLVPQVDTRYPPLD